MIKVITTVTVDDLRLATVTSKASVDGKLKKENVKLKHKVKEGEIGSFNLTKGFNTHLYKELVELALKRFNTYFPKDKRLANCADIEETKKYFESNYKFEFDFDIMAYPHSVFVTIDTPYGTKKHRMSKGKMVSWEDFTQYRKNTQGVGCKWTFQNGFYGEGVYLEILGGKFKGKFCYLGNYKGNFVASSGVSGYFTTCKTVDPKMEFKERYEVAFVE